MKVRETTTGTWKYKLSPDWSEDGKSDPPLSSSRGKKLGLPHKKKDTKGGVMKKKKGGRIRVDLGRVNRKKTGEVMDSAEVGDEKRGVLHRNTQTKKKMVHLGKLVNGCAENVDQRGNRTSNEK